MSSRPASTADMAVAVRPETSRVLRVIGGIAIGTYALMLTGVVLTRAGVLIRLALYPQEAMYGESIIYDQAARLLHAEPLYQTVGAPNYSATAYGPIYYWLAALLQIVVGPGFLPGRVLSITAGVLVAVMIGHLARIRAHSTFAGCLAAALFLAAAFRSEDPWLAFYKEDMVGLALAVASVVVLCGARSYRALILAGVLAGLAILTKQTLLAASAAGFVCLLSSGWRRVGVFVATVAVLVLGTAAALEATTHAFVTNTIFMNVNPFSGDVLVSNLAIFLKYQAAQIGLAAVFLFTDAKNVLRRPLDPLLVYGAFSLLPLAGLAKVGSNYNYWIELAAVLSVLATLGVWKITRSVTRYSLSEFVLVTVLLALSLVQLGSHVRELGASDLRSLTRIAATVDDAAQQRAEFQPVVDRVRSEPGGVLADPLDVLPLSERDILLEPYLFSILSAEGQWDPQPIVARVCRGDIRLAVLGYPLEVADQAGYHGYSEWPRSVLAALRATMRPEAQIAGRFLYTWHPAVNATGDTVCQDQH